MLALDYISITSPTQSIASLCSEKNRQKTKACGRCFAGYCKFLPHLRRHSDYDCEISELLTGKQRIKAARFLDSVKLLWLKYFATWLCPYADTYTRENSNKITDLRLICNDCSRPVNVSARKLQGCLLQFSSHYQAIKK